MYIGVFRNKYPVYSEVFITEQVSNYRNKSCMICRDNLNIVNSDSDIEIFQTISGFWSKLFFTLFGYVRSKRLKLFSDIELLHAHFGQDGYYAMRIAEKLNIPFMVTYHGQDCTVKSWDKIKTCQLSNLIYVLFKRKIFKKAARIIAVSEFVKQELIKQGCNKDKIVVQYIGVDVRRFSYTPREKKDANYPVQLLCVGRHTEKKGLRYLLEALSVCDGNFTLSQIGEGELTEQLKGWIKEYGLENKITLLGSVPSTQVNEQMKQSDIFVLPSVRAENGDSEAFGIVFIEASAVGLPVISTRHGGIPEAVQDGISGLLVDERDSKGLAKALDALIADSELRLELGAKGRKMVEENFDIQQRTAELEKLYGEIIFERNK
jgi:colanic acid/amylovoran biosynthesis glycosyltransferase